MALVRRTPVPASLPFLFFLAAIVVAAASHGCGRTSLDDGFGPADGATSSGTGGLGQSGVGGSGAGGATSTLIVCGTTTTCLPGKQVCCNRVVNNQLVQSCIPQDGSVACPGGTISCNSSLACPRNLPVCCTLSAQLGIGLCGLPSPACAPLGP
jgi:hypothetical protein